MTSLLGKVGMAGPIMEHPKLPPYVGKAILSSDQTTINLALNFSRSCPPRSVDTA